MPKIDISDAVFKRLETLAKPESFVDNPNEVIKKLIDFYENSKPITKFDPENPPNHRHSTISSAKIQEQPVSGWNELVRQILKEIYDRSQKAHEQNPSNLDELQTILNDLRNEIRRGRYEEKGFHYDPELDVSIQGFDANSAWRHAYNLAKKHEVKIEIVFQLSDGKRGTFEDCPTPPDPQLPIF